MAVEAHTGEDPEEPAGYQVHEPAAEVLQGTGGVAVAGPQDQVRQDLVPEEPVH